MKVDRIHAVHVEDSIDNRRVVRTRDDKMSKDLLWIGGVVLILIGLFVAIVGEIHDGHRFTPETRAKGCVNLVAAGTGASGATAGDVETDDGAIDGLTTFYNARPASIYGGSNEIQRNILAKGVLELPG